MQAARAFDCRFKLPVGFSFVGSSSIVITRPVRSDGADNVEILVHLHFWDRLDHDSVCALFAQVWDISLGVIAKPGLNVIQVGLGAEMPVMPASLGRRLAIPPVGGCMIMKAEAQALSASAMVGCRVEGVGVGTSAVDDVVAQIRSISHLGCFNWITCIARPELDLVQFRGEHVHNEIGVYMGTIPSACEVLNFVRKKMLATHAGTNGEESVVFRTRVSAVLVIPCQQSVDGLDGLAVDDGTPTTYNVLQFVPTMTLRFMKVLTPGTYVLLDEFKHSRGIRHGEMVDVATELFRAEDRRTPLVGGFKENGINPCIREHLLLRAAGGEKLPIIQVLVFGTICLKVQNVSHGAPTVGTMFGGARGWRHEEALDHA